MKIKLYKKLNIKFLFALILVPVSFSYGQISKESVPYSFKNKIGENIKQIKMPEFDIQRQIAEDEIYEKKNQIYRFGKVFDVSLNPENSGTFQTMENGDKLWRLEIFSEKAFSIGLFFDKYKLPEGAELFVYSNDRKHVIGAFTSENNKSFGKLALQQVRSDRIIVEYYEPASCSFSAELNIGNIIHDYKNEFNVNKDAKDCHININCPEGANWEYQKNAVCKITMMGQSCSGSMINNTSNNGKPYFLTARHCVNSLKSAESIVFIFNYESKICQGERGDESNTTSGSELLASPKSDEYDFTLLEMSEFPPDKYKPYFAGWNMEEIPAESLTGIHHAAGGVKKISIDNDPPEDASAQFDNYNFLPMGHWRMIALEKGFYEPGSSGSPAFNQDKQIAGILSGVTYDNCDYPFSIYASKFSKAWNWTDDPTQSLKYWLDPEDTGLTNIEGFTPFQYDNDIAVLSVSDIHNIYCDKNIKVNPKVNVVNRGTSPIDFFQLTAEISGNIIYSKKINKLLKVREVYSVALGDIELENNFSNLKIYATIEDNSSDQNPANDTLKYNTLNPKLYL